MAAQPRASSARAKAMVCSTSQPPSTQSVRGDAHRHRPVGREGRAHRVEHFEREAHPVLEAAAIFVGAAVRERRQELVQQVAVRAVQLDRGEIEPGGAPAASAKASRMRSSPARSSSSGGFSSVSERERRGRDGLPAVRLVGRNLLAAVPRLVGRGLAAGMAELDRDRHVRPAPHARQHPRHRLLVGVRPQAGVAVADAPFRRDRGRLDRQQRRAGQRQLAEVDDVPVGHAAVLGRILAHRRDDDAVAKLEAADIERAEQSGHGDPYAAGRARAGGRPPSAVRRSAAAPGGRRSAR